MTAKPSPLDIARRFLGRINAHDVKGLMAMTTPDHRFFDSLGHEVRGEDALRAAWRQYFRMIPDYRIEIQKMFCHGPHVVIVGVARGTYAPNGGRDPLNVWSMPAAWYAATFAGRVAEWRVYADNEPLRRCMARTAPAAVAPAALDRAMQP